MQTLLGMRLCIIITLVYILYTQCHVYSNYYTMYICVHIIAVRCMHIPTVTATKENDIDLSFTFCL